MVDLVEIDNAHLLFQEYVKQGKMLVGAFEDKSDREMAMWYKMILYQSAERSNSFFIKRKIGDREMAVDVIVKQKGIFGKNITIEDIVGDDLSYGIMDENYRLKQGEQGEYMVVYDSRHLGRGMEVSFEKKDVNLRLPLPNSEEDIRLFYQTVERVCRGQGVHSFYRDGEKIGLGDFENLIQLDMDASTGALESMERGMKKGEYSNMIVFAIHNPIYVEMKDLEQMKGADNCYDLKKFGEFLEWHQRMNVYYAAPLLYQKKDETVFGVYAISADVPSVVPSIPKLLAVGDNELKVEEWYVALVIAQGNVKSVKYQDFIEFAGQMSC